MSLRGYPPETLPYWLQEGWCCIRVTLGPCAYDASPIKILCLSSRCGGSVLRCTLAALLLLAFIPVQVLGPMYTEVMQNRA